MTKKDEIYALHRVDRQLGIPTRLGVGGGGLGVGGGGLEVGGGGVRGDQLQWIVSTCR